MTNDNSLPSAFVTLPAQWDEYCTEKGHRTFRSKQICDWLFRKKATDPQGFSNLPDSLKAQLQEAFSWRLPTIITRLDSDDGASKLLMRGETSQAFEAVILRYENRTSLCVSSQVGCKLACSFCQTGKLGFFRNLATWEILGQFIVANALLQQEGRQITHVVFMGMGEPLDNVDAVSQSCRILTDPRGFGLSHSRVTVSTSGLPAKIQKLASTVRVALAVSLHASRDELRSELMPINRRFPLAKLKESLVEYQIATGDMITIEYILIAEKNCGRREAKELVRFLHGLRAKINLIPFNPHPGLPYQRPSAEKIREFQQYLASRGYPAPVRYSKGMGVSAACGQLAAKKIADQVHDAPRRRSVIEATS